MAGRGTRTQQLGPFKPFIEVSGTRMLGWLFRSIKSKIRTSDKLVFVTTERYAAEFNVPDEIAAILCCEGIYNGFELLTCRETPPGPAATVYQAKELLLSGEPAIVVNCDQYVDFDMTESLQSKTGFLAVYAEFGQKSSYVEIKNGLITRIVEKQNISNLASAGLYALSDARDLIWAIERQFELGQTNNGEFYVGVALNNLIREGYRFYPAAVRAKYDLGCIEGVQHFGKVVSAVFADAGAAKAVTGK